VVMATRNLHWRLALLSTCPPMKASSDSWSSCHGLSNHPAQLLIQRAVFWLKIQDSTTWFLIFLQHVCDVSAMLSLRDTALRSPMHWRFLMLDSFVVESFRTICSCTNSD
jgi:hypothetical protein